MRFYCLCGFLLRQKGVSSTMESHLYDTSRQDSPVPKRQMLSPLSLNERSFSRWSSKAGSMASAGDLLLLSPLPFFPPPLKRRSVRFASRDGASGESPVREVRPDVTRDSPPPVSILKGSSRRPAAGGALEPISRQGSRSPRPAAQVAGATEIPRVRRTRSASRQRLAQRRRAAQLDRSFYDDSFVEEFVLAARSELQEEEEKRRSEEEKVRMTERLKRTAERLKEDSANRAALERARSVLLAAGVHPPRTASPPPQERRERKDGGAGGEAEKYSLRDASVQAALEEIRRLTVTSTNTPAADAPSRDGQRSTMRSATPSGAARTRRRVSIPLVSNMDEELGELGTSRHRSLSVAKQRAKAEGIVEKLMAEHSRRRSKQSVVVINWSDSEEEEEEVQQPCEDEEAVQEGIGKKRRRGGILRRAPPKAVRRNCAPPLHPSSTRREVSAVPDLSDSVVMGDEDDTDLHEERPVVLLRRESNAYSSFTGGSQSAASEEDELLNGSLDPKQRSAPTTTRRRATRGAHVQDMFASAAPPRRPLSTAQSRRVSSHSRSLSSHRPRLPANDPMAVFFEAAFPSPSKFDALLQTAGGLTATRSRRNQPNLSLPTSIVKKKSLVY